MSATVTLPPALAALWQGYGARVVVVSAAFALLTCRAMRGRIRATAVLVSCA